MLQIITDQTILRKKSEPIVQEEAKELLPKKPATFSSFVSVTITNWPPRGTFENLQSQAEIATLLKDFRFQPKLVSTEE